MGSLMDALRVRLSHESPGEAVRIAILGSGATAVACALALRDEFKRNGRDDYQVEILDYAMTEQPEHATGESEDRGHARKNMPTREYVFDIPSSFKTNSHLEGRVAGSAAAGGWSNVWGATLQPYTTWGLSHWGAAAASLKAEYRFLGAFVPRLETSSDLHSAKVIERRLPVFVSLERERRDGDRVTRLGPSALAIDPLSDEQSVGCNQCGECLRGCPADHIWSSLKTWPELYASGQFRSRPGVWVRSVQQVDKAVAIVVTDNAGTELELRYDRVFVALGALQTGALALRSGIANNEVVVRDSRMILIPFRRERLAPTGSDDPRISLCDGYALGTSQSSTNTSNASPDFYAQVYGFSRSLDEHVAERLPVFAAANGRCDVLLRPEPQRGSPNH